MTERRRDEQSDVPDRPMAKVSPRRTTAAVSALTKSSSWATSQALNAALPPPPPCELLVGGQHRVAVVPVQERLGVQPEVAPGRGS